MISVATSDRDVHLDVGDTWIFSVSIPAGATATVVVTNPAGEDSDPVPVEATELVTVQVLLVTEGRYLAVVTVTLGGVTDVVPFTAWAAAPGGPPGLTAVKAYLSSNGDTSAPDAVITEALNAEEANQRAMCYTDSYGYDLAEALKRRVARNLAARSVPIASLTTFDGGSTESRVQRYDAEVTRFEGPYRRMVVG